MWQGHFQRLITKFWNDLCTLSGILCDNESQFDDCNANMYVHRATTYKWANERQHVRTYVCAYMYVRMYICMYVHIYVSVSVCMYLCICTDLGCVHIRVCASVLIYSKARAHTHTHTHTHTHIYIYTYMCVCMYIHMYVCTYVTTYLSIYLCMLLTIISTINGNSMKLAFLRIQEVLRPDLGYSECFRGFSQLIHTFAETVL